MLACSAFIMSSRATPREQPVNEDRTSPGSPVAGWLGFCCWAVVGILAALALVGMASIGLLVLPAALIAAFVATAYVPAGRELWGVVAGIGFVGILVGVLNLDYYRGSCPDAPITTARETAGCGGLDPLPWFAVGSLLAIGSIGVYSWLARNRG